MITTILCAVDVNRPEEERKVLETAGAMAKANEAQLDVIAVVPDFGSTMVAAYFEDHHVQSAKDTAGEALSAMVAGVLGDAVNAKARHIVAMGPVYKEILEAAKLGGADLIVMGAHRPDFKDFLLGPNASHVVTHAECSVYVVR
jgi:nucleotide-binding universal stress UspA family protein